MYAICLNGPPRSGKDTLANFLVCNLQYRGKRVIKRSFSLPMRKRAYAALGMTYSESHYEANKDTPLAILGGETLRQFMINDTENFIKLNYGKDYWVKVLFDSIPIGFPGIVVIPDVGFQTEMDSIINRFGAKSTLLISTHREGYSFKGDSRNYVQSECWKLAYEATEGLDYVQSTADSIADICLEAYFR